MKIIKNYFQIMYKDTDYFLVKLAYLQQKLRNEQNPII